jgi:hypothetical protein
MQGEGTGCIGNGSLKGDQTKMKRSKRSSQRGMAALMAAFLALSSFALPRFGFADEVLNGVYASLEAQEDHSSLIFLDPPCWSDWFPGPVPIPDPIIIRPPLPVLPVLNEETSRAGYPDAGEMGSANALTREAVSSGSIFGNDTSYKRLKLFAKIVNPTSEFLKVDSQKLEFVELPASNVPSKFEITVKPLSTVVPAHSSVIVAEASVRVKTCSSVLIFLDDMRPRYFEFKAVVIEPSAAQFPVLSAQGVWTEGWMKLSNSNDQKILEKVTKLDEAVNGSSGASGIAEKVKDIDLNVQLQGNAHTEIAKKLEKIHTAARRILSIVMRKKFRA